MKKLLLISSCLCLASVVPAVAAETTVSCTTVPSCLDLGYKPLSTCDGTSIKCPTDPTYGICFKASDPYTSECEFKRGDAGTKVTSNWTKSQIVSNNPCGSADICTYSADEVKASGVTGQIVFISDSAETTTSYKVVKTSNGSTGTTVTTTGGNVYYACSKRSLGGESNPPIESYVAPCTSLKVYSTAYATPVQSSNIVTKAKNNCGGYLCSKTNIEKMLSNKTGFVITQNTLYNLSSGVIGSSASAITQSGKNIYFACSNSRESSLKNISLPSVITETVTYPVNISLSYIENKIKAKCSYGFADIYELETRLTGETGYVYGSRCLSPVTDGVMEKKCVGVIPVPSASTQLKIYYSCASIPNEMMSATTVNYNSTASVY